MSKTTKVTLKDGAEYSSIKEFCRVFNLNYGSTVSAINKRGWSPEKCINPKSDPTYRKHKADYSKTSRYSDKALEKNRIGNYARWIKRATKKHGNKFCYKNSQSDFNTAKNPDVQIVCLVHSHPFYIYPDKHVTLKNGGCEYCRKEQVTGDSLKREAPKFLAWFNENLSERLELRSAFQGWHQPLDLFCKTHKTVHKTTNPNNLKYSGAWGCDKCSTTVLKEKVRLDLSSVQRKINQTRDLPENITLVDIIFDEISEASRIVYSCSIDEHGIRPAISLSHLKRSKLICDLCTAAGGGTAHARYLRFIENNEDGDSAVIGVMQVDIEGNIGLKVGVTTRTLEDRYGYALKTIFLKLESKERHVYFIENRVKRKFAKFKDNTILGKGLRGELNNGNRWGGDTEIFQTDKQQEIIDFIINLADDIKFNRVSELEFREEADHFISINFDPHDVSREKDIRNEPVAIVGIDPRTNEIKYQLDSISAAIELGFKNISTILSGQTNRQISNGIRWFRASEFDPEDIPCMRGKMIHRKPVRCIETGKVFRTAGLAEKAMRSPEHLVRASKITSVCRGNSRKAGGYSWEYANEK